jgi:hypothetical protein
LLETTQRTIGGTRNQQETSDNLAEAAGLAVYLLPLSDHR